MNFGLFIGSGWANVDFTGILSAISRYYQVGEFSRVKVGFGGFIVRDNIVFLGNFWTFLGVEGFRDDRRITFNSSDFSANLGYVIYYSRLKERRFLVYPALGVGYSRFELRGGYVKNSEFSDILIDPAISFYANKGEYSGTISLNAHFDFGFLMGFRAGYTFPIYQTQWKSDFGEIRDVPKVENKGIWGQIFVGFGWDSTL
jgi:hypothetical protein